MIKPTDLQNMAVQPGELADRDEHVAPVEALEHGETGRRRTEHFDVNEPSDRAATDDDEEAT